jgi:hypothetical protein
LAVVENPDGKRVVNTSHRGAAERRLFAFWTGDNPMSDVRKRCLDTFALTGLEPTLVTADTITDWVEPDAGLHEAYPFLSAVHRSDYLRTYFMHHHGGGYADIKRQTGSWLPEVERLERSPRLVGAGYQEIRGGTVWPDRNVVAGRIYWLSRSPPKPLVVMGRNALRGMRPLLPGNCAYYFKPGTPFTSAWLGELNRRLDLLLPALKLHPARDPRDRQGSASDYPVPWSFLLGDIFQPLAALWSLRLSRGLPRPDFECYD